MALVLPHREGQYRAELFEELVRRILTAKYPTAKISQDCVTVSPSMRAHRVDFFVKASPRPLFVEARAPYSEKAWAGVKRSLRRLQDSTGQGNADAVLALGSPIPAEGAAELPAIVDEFRSKGVAFEIWDSTEILKLTESLLGKSLSSLSAEQILSVVSDVNEAASRQSALPEGRHKGVIVLMADFCSYSAFVRASEGDVDLISSIMGRLYRESRRVVLEYGGVLDKFMGDGLLAFWLPDRKVKSDPGRRLMDCATRLTGMAAKLAEEWQQRVDDHVAPVGMRCGAAVGEVLFIAEDPLNPALVHAIGDAINLAARLQSSADPNSLVVSNRLHTSYFRDASELVEFNPDAKNMGTKKAWKKAFA